jgi:hypothetical protein
MEVNMIEDIDYKYSFPEDDPEHIHIELLSGPFIGVVFKYDKVKFEEENKEMYLQFSYNVIQYNNFTNLESDLQFKNYIGDLLAEIMSKNMDQEIVDESRISDTEELNIQ